MSVPSLEERSRRSGAALAYRGPGDYTVTGDRWIGAVAVLEAVQDDVRRWTREVDSHGAG